ncbi:MAG TPA: energy transducer TonB [Flavobacteriales bacterium]|nr:energy transducer TonB [Flavobacteriales bacterium]
MIALKWLFALNVAFLSIPVAVRAQTDGSQPMEGDIHQITNDEEPARFPGGEQAMWAYIAKHFKYPIHAEIQGRVIIGFVVEVDGCLSQLRVIDGVGSPLDGEALRVVSSMPPWLPAELFGKPVPMKYTLPMHIKPR